MGTDFLDLTIRLEVNHHLRFDKSGIAAFNDARKKFQQRDFFGRTHDRWDWKVGTFYDLLHQNIYDFCDNCGYVLRSPTHSGNCPECGTPFELSCLTWEIFQEELSEIVKIIPSAITRDQWLIRELGFS
ncbi:MAG TPA: hypothetical protein VHM90_14160 [Phycisphaerae bacterium]|jgi:hypothetical protein|nr:hypothetical protein [Phycisphaerae bacterium]